MTSLKNSSNKLIAKNTILLYGRMLFIMAVSLYTSRVVLATLGFDDYGLYNVVGGIVTMFTFINYAMGNSSNRYIAFALGKGDEKELRDVVSATCLVHWIIAGVVLVLAETIGLWFLHYKIVIPEGREIAAEWVYQFSIISCIISIVNVPYNAMIIAHEKMAAFAILSIFDAILKLIIVYLIQISPGDTLIVYGALILVISIFNRVIYKIYCYRNFDEARYIKLGKVPQLKEITSFAGWSLIGNIAFIGYTQGLNILLNMFFGPSVNAARGIAVQVESALKGFVTNFQTAVNPQIVKTYAQNDIHRFHTLIFVSSKFSFFLLYCMVLPICIESNTILNLWLKDVPPYAVIFTLLILIISLSEPLRNPIDRANQAEGNIRKYQIVEGGLLLLIVPISYIVLKFGGKPYTVFIIQLFVMYSVQIVRLFLVCPKIKMSIIEYCKCVLLRVVAVSVTSAIIPILVHFLMPSSVLSLIVVVLLSIICVIVSSFCVGLSSNEKELVRSKMSIIKERIKR